MTETDEPPGTQRSQRKVILSGYSVNHRTGNYCRRSPSEKAKEIMAKYKLKIDRRKEIDLAEQN